MFKWYKKAARQAFISGRYNLLRQMLSPVTWLILGGGLLAINAFVFFIADLLGHNNATMAPFWGFLPFVLAVMAPLLAMRGMAAERQMGAADWLSTKPINPLYSDAGLLKSHMVLIIFWLLVSLILPMTLSFLGHPDWPLIASGYLAAFLLGGLFLSAAFFAANVAKSLLGAFLGGVLLNLALLFSAVEGVVSLSPFALSASAQNWVMTLSPIHAYERLYAGFIMAADVIWMVVLMYIFFLLGHWAHRVKGVYKPAGRTVSLSVIGLLGVAALAHSFLPQSIDITQDGRFKPSENALEVVKEIPADKIHISLFYSGGNSGMPSPLRTFGRQVQYYLQTLAGSSEKVSLTIIDPTQSPQAELAAQETDLEPHVAPDGSRSYLGLHIATPQADVTVPALLKERQHLFEFDLMNNIARLRHGQTRRIGVLTGLNMSDDKQRPVMLEMLAPFYRIDIINHTNAMLPDENDLIIVYGGTYLEEKAIYALDQYIQRGGRVLFVLDPFWFSAPAGRLQAMGANDGATGRPNISTLLAHLGLGFIPGQVLADPALGSPIQMNEGAGVTTHPLWLTLRSGEINQAHPLTRNLSKIAVAAGGLLHTNAPEGIKVTPLLSSSKEGHILPRRFMYEAEIENIDKFYQGNPQVYPLAAEAVGDFPAMFAQRPAFAQNWFDGEGSTWPERFIKPHQTDLEREARVIAVTDMDMFHPQLAAIGTLLQPANDNFNFMFNAVRHLLDEPEVLRIHLRHEASQRPFVRLESALSDLTAALSKQEGKIVQQLMDTRAEIADLRHEMEMKGFENPMTLEKLRDLRVEEVTFMHQLDRIRARTFKAARYFISLLTAINVLGGLFLFMFIGWMYKIRHFRRVNRRLQSL